MENFVHNFTSFINEMAIKPREEMYRPEKIEIDLSGPQGNAFYLIGLAQKLYRKKYPERLKGYYDSLRLAKEIDPEAKLTSPDKLFSEELMSLDYEHLLKVFDDEFGDWVTLYR